MPVTVIWCEARVRDVGERLPHGAPALAVEGADHADGVRDQCPQRPHPLRRQVVLLVRAPGDHAEDEQSDLEVHPPDDHAPFRLPRTNVAINGNTP